MPKLPVISGDKLIKLLTKLGYEIVRQKGSHVRLRKKTEIGEHNITVPKHREIAKGTINQDVIRNVIGEYMTHEPNSPTLRVAHPLGHLTGGYVASPSATPKFIKTKLRISSECYANN